MANPALAQDDGRTLQPAAATLASHGLPIGFTVAASLGFGLGFGGLYTESSDPSTPVPVLLEPGLQGNVSRQFPLSLGLGYRPIPRFSFGLAAGLAPVTVVGCYGSCDGRIVRLGIEARVHFMTDRRVSPWLSVGLGHERLGLNAEIDIGSTTFSGYELVLAAGGDVLVGSGGTLGPYVDLRVGRYGHVDSNPSFRGASPRSFDLADANRATHAWLSFGLRGTLTLM